MNINGFIWSIADNVLHHLYDRTKYRDIILPTTVIRWLGAVLEQRSLLVGPAVEIAVI